MTKKVYIPSRTTLGADDMFKDYGWNVLRDWDIKDNTVVDLVCFTGGADISPALYGEEEHRYTYTSLAREKIELAAFERFKDKAPMAGICRGGQLLNVLNGGKMYQDVNNHHSGPHLVTTAEGHKILVSSVHHQMMIPPDDAGIVLAWASLATYKATANDEIHLEKPTLDPEVIFFPRTRHLCFQGHPEFGPASCTEYFFNLLKEHLNV